MTVNLDFSGILQQAVNGLWYVYNLLPWWLWLLIALALLIPKRGRR
ncbi:MAG TPA: hypothetical protein VF828_01160 [Patescibacteria group bacterium]